MKLHRVKLLTIIAPDVLETKITTELIRLGAKGYTVAPAIGAGLTSLRDNEWTGRNVRVETLARAETATKIMAHIAEQYFEKHGVIAFLTDAEVLRKDRYE